MVKKIAKVENVEAINVPVEYDINRRIIRGIVRGAYQLQKLRIAIGLRIVSQWKAKAGQAPSQNERELSTEDKKLLDRIRADYKLITDGVVMNIKMHRDFPAHGLIDDYAELSLIHQYEQQLAIEKEAFRNIERALTGIPLWDEFLVKVNGIGPAIGGIIISELNIYEAKYASCLWKYIGVDVAEDGRGRGKYPEHLVDKTYTDASGKEKTTKSITFNPTAKSKLVYLLGDSFIKSKSVYSDIYYNYRNRLLNRADIKWYREKREALITDLMLESKPKKEESKAAYERRLECITKDAIKVYPKYTDGHIRMMGKRYMVKMFIIDLYKFWRDLEGLPVYDPYHEAKLGLYHGGK